MILAIADGEDYLILDLSVRSALPKRIAYAQSMFLSELQHIQSL